LEELQAVGYLDCALLAQQLRDEHLALGLVQRHLAFGVGRVGHRRVHIGLLVGMVVLPRHFDVRVHRLVSLLVFISTRVHLQLSRLILFALFRRVRLELLLRGFDHLLLI
jgi:hypothetical protein